ncbi:DNA adenine methylase [Phyllobacterium sp. A18/5-2]|nr:DNA adenine methylase [Phyllobacterium sp. A18/5-2]
MGTKRRLAAQIADIAKPLPTGPFLDLFSGVSAVGMAVSPDRHVWCNDVQHFSNLLTRALYTSSSGYNVPEFAWTQFTSLFIDHRNSLITEFNDLSAAEDNALRGTSAAQIDINAIIVQQTRGRLKSLRDLSLHCLFTTTHAGTYFGFNQSLEIDSIRFAADQTLKMGLIDDETHRWMLVALCRAVSAASNSTGHFAQYLTPKQNNINRVVAKRRRSVWSDWLQYISATEPIGTVEWRSHNQVFRGDANEILQQLLNAPRQPAIIYADPPYTNDQYSRYYHVLENVVCYDYPNVSGKGEYRSDRFVSDFSLSKAVSGAFERLIAGAARLNAALMISYPSNGLMPNSTERILNSLKMHFTMVGDPIVIPHEHSTMGASKGLQKHQVSELIFTAY